MILFTEEQLDEAWRYDCRIRSSFNAQWITRTQYEKLFVYYIDSLIAGEKFIKLDIHIPKNMLESIDYEIHLETEDTIH